MKKRPIQVWYWDEAPEELKVCGHGGDEDYLILVPCEYIDNGDHLDFLAEMILERVSYSKHVHRDIEWSGGRVRIYVTAHA